MRRVVCTAGALTLLLAFPVDATSRAPAGRYVGTQQEAQDGNGSAHKVSFTVGRGRLRKLVIAAGQAFCHPPSARKPGFAPGYFLAPSPRLSGFPAVKIRRRGRRYFVKVAYRRSGSSWKITRSRSRVEGAGYVTIAGSFEGKRFNRSGVGNLSVQYGADAEGKPTYAPGHQQCNFAGSLNARRR